MFVSAEFIRYALQVIFALAGLTKFIPDRRVIRDQFPRLPSAFWPVAGVWELGIVFLLWLQYDFIATAMCYVFLGGVLGSSLLHKGSDGLTMAGKTYGIALVPGLATLGAVAKLADLQGYSLLIGIPATITGVLVSLVLIKAGKKDSRQKL